MKRTAIFDLDGTLADASKRLHFIQGEKKDWDGFFRPENLAMDAVIEPVAEALEALEKEYAIVFCTGRPQRTQAATVRWLSQLSFLGIYRLMMRADDDRRPSAEVKRDHLQTLRGDGYRPVIAFEDRADDTAMWRAEGLVCFQVAEGAY